MWKDQIPAHIGKMGFVSVVVMDSCFSEEKTRFGYLFLLA